MLVMNSKLGTLIQAAREQRGINTQTELGRRIGKHPGWVSRLETGVMKELPTPEDLREISQNIGVPELDLLRAAGYLTDHDDSDGVMVRRDDPRFDALSILRTMTDDEVIRFTKAMVILSGATQQNQQGDVTGGADETLGVDSINDTHRKQSNTDSA